MENGGLVPHSVVVAMSDWMIEDARSMQSFIDLYDPRTPAERNAERQAAADRRAAVRNATPQVAPSLARVTDRLGWGPRYTEHFCQLYCDCYDGSDGWELCIHARDLGLETHL